MRVAAVVLDMDGLMVDTEPIYKFAWQRASAELGCAIDDALYSKFIGRRTVDCEALVVERFGAAFPLEEFRKKWPVLWRQKVADDGIETKPGLHELLSFAADQQLPVAVATSSERSFVDATLGTAGLSDRFAAIVCGDDIERGKPEPDIYLEAARKLGVEPAACVGFEDSEAGIRAIARAGMTGILVPHWPATPLAISTAFRVVQNLYEGRDVLASLMLSR